MNPSLPPFDARPGRGDPTTASPPWWYRGLLACYPAPHRARYGPGMEQAFRDQRRALGSRPPLYARLRFVLRLLADFARTCPAEHWHDFRRNPRVSAGTRQVQCGITVGGVLAAVVLGWCLWVTALLPFVYLSTARVQSAATSATHDPFTRQAAVARVQSEPVLSQVVQELGLNERWSAEVLGGRGTLVTAETIGLLRDRLEVSPIRLTPLLEIRAYGTDRDETARIANAVARAYVRQEQSTTSAAQDGPTIVDPAEPGLSPVRPNVPLNVAMGLLAAVVVGAGSGLGTWWTVRRFRSV